MNERIPEREKKAHTHLNINKFVLQALVSVLSKGFKGIENGAIASATAEVSVQGFLYLSCRERP